MQWFIRLLHSTGCVFDFLILLGIIIFGHFIKNYSVLFSRFVLDLKIWCNDLQIAVERKFTRGRRTTQVAAACLYIACRSVILFWLVSLYVLFTKFSHFYFRFAVVFPKDWCKEDICWKNLSPIFSCVSL